MTRSEAATLLPVSASISWIVSISSPKSDSPSPILHMAWEDFNDVAAHPKSAAKKRLIVSLILKVDKFPQDIPPVATVANLEGQIISS